MEKTKPSALILKRLKLKNIRGFKDADVIFDRPSGQPNRTLFIGENGHGKTTLLRAIALGLCQKPDFLNLMNRLAGPMLTLLRQTKKNVQTEKGTIQIELCEPDAPDQVFIIKTTIIMKDGEPLDIDQKTEPKIFPWSRIFVCGYGINRGSFGNAQIEAYAPEKAHEKAIISLIQEGSHLYHPEEVLKNFKLIDTEEQGGTLNYALTQLKTLFKLNPNQNISVSVRGITVTGPWGTLPLGALGDGYRGTAAWVLDFLMRSLLAHRSVTDPGGIVLIDEIDEHLHPQWQRTLLPTLNKLFPKVQFIGTTHNPMTLIECGSNEIYHCVLKNTVSTVTQELPPLDGLTMDQVYQEWFHLQSTMTPKTEKLLKEYRDAVTSQQSEETLYQLRHRIRQEIGPLSITPMDELALRISHAYRDRYYQAPKTMQPNVIDNAVQELRKQVLG